MTHVVTEACVGHKYQDCVAVCPVEAFREQDDYLVIDPDECIDCAACIPECPVEAIFADTDLPDDQEHWLERTKMKHQTYQLLKEILLFWQIVRF